jgi:hypothetical protein
MSFTCDFLNAKLYTSVKYESLLKEKAPNVYLNGGMFKLFSWNFRKRINSSN